MPHHSKHRRPHTQVAESCFMEKQGVESQPHTNANFPSPVERSRMGMQPSMPPQSRPVGWPSSATVGSSGSDPQSLYHRVPESPDVKKQVRNPGKDNVNAIEGDRAAAASVLLLAAAAQQKAEEQEQEESDIRARQVKSPDNYHSTSPTGSPNAVDNNRPLKKRKTLAAMEKSNDHAKDPCNVSPMSHHSTGNKSAATNATTEATTTTCDETVCTTASSAVSYEDHQKDEEEISHVNEHKKQPTSDGPGRQPLPVGLHWLLTESASQAFEDSATVRTILQWLPHGQAWKIVRWDAFRKQILPKFFPQFRVEDGASSLDVFLTQLTAWGFEEIRDGPDVGSFAHTLFRRGHPQLCLEMTFSPSSGNKNPLEKKSFNQDSRSILRVPSLGSTESKEQTFYGNTPPVFVNYRPDEEWRGPPQTYSPVRIRSGRGARRQAPPSSPSTFPVSNRGRRKTTSPEPRTKRQLPLTSEP